MAKWQQIKFVVTRETRDVSMLLHDRQSDSSQDAVIPFFLLAVFGIFGPYLVLFPLSLCFRMACEIKIHRSHHWRTSISAVSVFPKIGFAGSVLAQIALPASIRPLLYPLTEVFFSTFKLVHFSQKLADAL